MGACGGGDDGRAQAGELSIRSAIVAPVQSPPGAAGYMTIRNAGRRAVALTAVQVEGAKDVRLLDAYGGPPLRQLTIPAQSRIRLEPGGTHLEFTGMPRSLVAGDSIAIELRFDSGTQLTFQAPVVPPINAVIPSVANLVWWCASLTGHDGMERSYFWVGVLLAFVPVGVFGTIAVLVARGAYHSIHSDAALRAVGSADS